MASKAVVLLSGGIDSSTTLAIAKDAGFDVHALSFRYGQKNRHESAAAKRIAKGRGITKHLILDIDLSSISTSALTSDIPVPKNRPDSAIENGIPVTYVPARNTIFLTLALAWAESLGAQDIFIGVNAMDYSGYPDCRPEFIEAFERMANLATKAGVEGRHFRVHTPLIGLTKAEIIRKGNTLGVDFGLTQSCYDPSEEGLACGACESCRLRRKGFREAGISDPTAYVRGSHIRGPSVGIKNRGG